MENRLTSDHRTDAQVGRAQSSGLRVLLPTVLPAMLVVLGLVLPLFMFEGDQHPSKIGLGPGAWPDAILKGMSFFAALWLAREIWVLGRAGRTTTLSPPDDDLSYSYAKAIGGLVMIVAYGWLLPLTGFALTTAAFIALWCVFGGVRKPLVVIPVSLLGTYALLWVFMGLALMPLSRGVGVFNSFSIALLQLLGIY
ncbi:tripartite tricarboxylate transporter TctB family protein [Tropicimonas sp. IMCC34043]|uniref:tripartite tricarboxylate transporter TctB family protein n=1 Tax=Tropicimonas sp. IMCC34043 TaxID=2248760 RepID=UPI00130050E1|nr:tripartite tricarboxylate transporter TctB family protein [Tropicimonas sp. IMCC34043]